MSKAEARTVLLAPPGESRDRLRAALEQAGVELVLMADPRFKDVPIVMITSRTGDKHRQRAMEIGVQRYMGKPYQELDLMRNVYDLLGIARVRE